jgi:hypothetical protein
MARFLIRVGVSAVAVMALLGIAAPAAQATTFTLTSFEANSFSEGDCTSTTGLNLDCDTSVAGPVTNRSYRATWEVDGASSGEFDLAGLSYPLAAGDNFAVYIKNSNGSVWDFEFIVYTPTMSYTSGVSPVSPSQTLAFYTAPFVSAESVVGAKVIVSGSNVDIDDDPDVNFNIRPIPEPGTLLLLGSGISALVLRRRRKS